MELRTVLLPLLFGTFAAVAQAQDHTIDFESLTGMNYVAGQPVPAASRLHDQFLSTLGVRFDSDAGYVAVVNLGSGHATSGVNGIGGTTAAGILTYSRQDPITFTFFDPSNVGQPAGTDFVSVRGDLKGGNSSLSELRAYDIAGNLLATSTMADVGGQTYAITSSTKNIHRVVFLGAPTDIDGIALDDLSFNNVAPVPEPTSLVAIGLGAITVFRRSRRR